jgi:MOSC domain-containing protein YiiM
MESVEEVRAVPGRGLEGDRYYTGCGTFSPEAQKPDFELTLIEAEQIAHFAAGSGLTFTAQDARRNIVTAGVDLNALAGREFHIGNVRVRGLRLCEPCSYLARITTPEVLRGLVHRGGLRAQILTEGIIRCGDAIRAAEGDPAPVPNGSDRAAAECGTDEPA